MVMYARKEQGRGSLMMRNTRVEKGRETFEVMLACLKRDVTGSQNNFLTRPEVLFFPCFVFTPFPFSSFSPFSPPHPAFAFIIPPPSSLVRFALHEQAFIIIKHRLLRP